MFGFFSDPALTEPLPMPATTLPMTTMLDGTTVLPTPAVVYFGSTEVGRTLTNYGGGEITVAAVDAAPASGLPASAVLLALSEAGLATATGGDSLEIGELLTSGAENSVAVWVAVDASADVGNYTDLSLVTSQVVES